MLEGLGLVRVKLADAARDQRLLERRRQRLGEVSEDAGLGGLVADGAYRGIRVRHPFLEARDGSGETGAPSQNTIVFEEPGWLRKS